MDDDRYYDFGLDTGQTYIDHHDSTKRINYLRRHMGNETEHQLIDDLIPSAALFSAYLLWGPYDNLDDNLDNLQRLLDRKYRPHS